MMIITIIENNDNVWINMIYEVYELKRMNNVVGTFNTYYTK